MGDRSSTVSSFTIVKGAFIAETREILSAWDFRKSKRENLDDVRKQARFGTRAATWNRDVAKVLNRRLDPATADRPLVQLARSAAGIETWRAVLLWHITRDEFLLRDFLIEFLFRRYVQGVHLVGQEEVEGYLATIRKRGAVVEHEWSPATTARVAAGLLKIAADFGFVRGRRQKEILPYRISEEAFLYVLHALKRKLHNVRVVIDSQEWRLFMLRPDDVEREILRLHQLRRLRYQVAGSLAELDLPCRDEAEYAETIIAL